LKKDFYSITDIATMTRFSTRTIRTYIKSGLLNGSKIDGAWAFVEGDIRKFLSEQFVKQGVQIKNDSLVRDFIDNTKKSVNSVCSIYDYVVENNKEAECLCDKIIDEINSNQYGKMEFSFSYDDNIKIVRIIVTGQTELIAKLMQKF